MTLSLATVPKLCGSLAITFRCCIARSAENDSTEAVAGTVLGGLNSFRVSMANARQSNKERIPALVVLLIVFKIFILVMGYLILIS